MEKLTHTDYIISCDVDLPEHKRYGKLNRYNGGWSKEITGVDRNKNNGYSLIGEFVENGKEGDYRVTTGKLYLDCNIDGSRKNQEKIYTIFNVSITGTISILYQTQDDDNNKTWVWKVWDVIDEFLNQKKSIRDQLSPLSPDDPRLSTNENLAIFTSAELYNELICRGFSLEIKDNG